jgi:hypothetical protein
MAMGITITSIADTFQIQFKDDGETTNSNEDEVYLTLDLVTEKVFFSLTLTFLWDIVFYRFIFLPDLQETNDGSLSTLSFHRILQSFDLNGR